MDVLLEHMGPRNVVLIESFEVESWDKRLKSVPVVINHSLKSMIKLFTFSIQQLNLP